MSTPINLNKARKTRARAAKKAQADANAVTFGVARSDKDRAKGEVSRMARDLDGKALETPPYRLGDGNKKP